MQKYLPLTDKQRRLVALAVVALVLGVAVLQHLHRMSRIAFMTHDDMAFDLFAQDVRHGGPSAYLARAAQLAREEGRATYFTGLIFMISPYLVHSDVARASLETVVQLVSVAAVAAFLVLYIEPIAAALFLLLYYGLLPHQWNHFPIGAYPLFVHGPVALFFVSLSVYIARLRGARLLQARYIKILCFVFLGWSLLVYEALSFLFAGVTLGVLLFEGRDPRARSWPALLRSGVARHLGLCLVFVAAGCVYFGYRLGHPSGYAGTAVTGSSVISVGKFANVIFDFAVFAFPTANFFALAPRLAFFSNGSLDKDGALRFLLANVTAMDCWWALLLASAVALLAWLFDAVVRPSEQGPMPSDGGPGGLAASPSRLSRAVAIAFVAAFATQIPVALSPKYQADPRAWAPYFTGYLSYVAFTVCLAALLPLAVRRIAARGGTSVRWLIVGAGCVCFVACVLNAVASGAALRSQADHYVKWRLLRLADKNGAFQKMPDGSLIVAPSLWNGISPAWQPGRQYWSEYFARHFEKRVRVVADWPELGREEGNVYHVSLLQANDTEDSAILCARVDWCDGGFCGQRLSRNVSVISESDLKAKDLSVVKTDMLASVSLGLPESGRRGVAMDLPLDGRAVIAGGYRADLASDGILLEGINLVPHRERVESRPVVDVVFERGFSGLERSGSTYWRWSDGPSGSGVLALVNHAHLPLQVHFAATIATGRGEPIPCEVGSGGTSERFLAANLQRFSRTLFLMPGRNELRLQCTAKRLDAPNDPRHIVFGLQNWELTDAGTSGLLRAASKDGLGNVLDLGFPVGFSGVEKAGADYWRWSDGAEGKGTIELNNRTGKPLSVLFFAEIATGHREESHLLIEHGSVQKRFILTEMRQQVFTELLLPPGVSRMSIRSDARRVPAPSDPRFMVFAVYNYRVVARSLDQADAICSK